MAVQALIRRLQAEDVPGIEKQSLVLAIALLPTPSPHLIQTLEDLINEESDESSTLLLTYGSLVANASPDQEQGMVTFLTDRIPEDSAENTGTLIHLLHALGNTKSALAVHHIVQYMHHRDRDVRLTTVIALRFFTNRPDIQSRLMDMLVDHSSSAAVRAIIHALHDGYKYHKEMALNQELVESLVNVTNTLKDSYLEDELILLLRAVGAPSTLTAANLIDSRRDDLRWKRDAFNRDSSTDAANFPFNCSYNWSKTLGKDEGDYKFFLKSVAELFVGGDICTCNLKALGKASVQAHLLGIEENALELLAYVIKQNAILEGRIYAQVAGQVLLDIDITERYTYQFPQLKRTLFSVSYTFVVYIVPVTLTASLTGAIGGNMNAGVGVSEHCGIQGDVVIAPKVTATVEGTASASILVSILCVEKQ